MSNPIIYFEQAEFALAAYSNLNPSMVFEDYVEALENGGEGLSPSQADTFATNYSVKAEHSDATGLSATVFFDNNTGETYLAIRGTEVTDTGDIFAGLSITLFGTTVLQPQYASLKAKISEDWLLDGTLPQTFTVTGHSLGGFLATGLVDDPTFVNNVSHAYLFNTPGVGGILGSFADTLLGFLGLSPVTDTSKISNIEAAIGASPIAGLGFDVAPLINIIIEDQTNPDVTNAPISKNHSQQVLTSTSNTQLLYPHNLSSIYGLVGSVIKNTSKLLVLQISLFFISLLLCLTSMAQDANDKGTSPMKNSAQNLLEICQHKITDYQSLKIEIEERYAVGSSVTLLQNDFEQYFGAIKEKKLVKDYLFMKNKNEDANSWIYFYSKTCNYAPSYSVQWNIYILTDLTKNITAINLLPILQTTELGLINVPFSFDFFENAEAMRKALWSLTGAGTEKNKIVALMLEAGGKYGDLETIKIKNPEKRLGYRYRYISEVLIASRIAPWEFSYAVIWEFDDQNRLIDLTVR